MFQKSPIAAAAFAARARLSTLRERLSEFRRGTPRRRAFRRGPGLLPIGGRLQAGGRIKPASPRPPGLWSCFLWTRRFHQSLGQDCRGRAWIIANLKWPFQEDCAGPAGPTGYPRRPGKPIIRRASSEYYVILIVIFSAMVTSGDERLAPRSEERGQEKRGQ